MEPTVSVIIPAYRAQGTIARALDSALGQSRPPEEIIVVDDGSPDQQNEVIEGYGSSVRLVRQENQKSAAARNAGIAAANGTWIAFLDADDYWESSKLEAQLAVLDSQPLVRLISSSYFQQSPTGPRILPRSHRGTYWDQRLTLSGAEAFYCGCLAWTSTVMARADVLRQMPFESGLEPAEDRDLWVRIAARYPIYLMSAPLATAVLEPNGISRQSVAVDCAQMLRVVQRHAGLLGPAGSALWRSYIRYRWSANEPMAGPALAALGRSFLSWPLPYVGFPAMQPLGRVRRLLTLLRALMSDPKFEIRTETVR